MKVKKEEVFSVPAHNFGISASESGYTLNYSVDGKTFTQWDESTPAGETLFVANAPAFCRYMLEGNTDDVEVRW